MSRSDQTPKFSSATPAWASSTARSLTDTKPPFAVDPLTPFAALDELCVIVEAVGRSGSDAPRGQDLESLERDVVAALAGIGGEYRAACAMTVDRVLSSELPAAIASLRAVSKTKSRPSFLDPLIATSRELHEQLSKSIAEIAAPAGLVGAWRDLLAAYEHSASVEIRLLRQRQVAELAERLGHQWHPLGLASRLSGLLTDRDGALAALRGDAHSAIRDPAPWPRRLAQIDDLLLGAPERGHVVVWLTFFNATLNRGIRELGPVTMYDARRVMPQVVNGTIIPEHIRAPELTAPYAASWFERSYLDEEELAKFRERERVCVRVNLGVTDVASSIDRAREIVEAIVVEADPQSVWRLGVGGVGYVDGEGWWGSHPEDPALLDYYRAQDGILSQRITDHLLDNSPAELAQRAIDRSPLVIDALRELRMLHAARRADTAPQRVALQWRVIDRALQPGNSFVPVAIDLLRARWVIWHLQRLLSDVGHRGVMAIADREDANRDRFIELRNVITPSNRGGDGWSVNYDRVVEHAHEVAALVPEGRFERQILELVVSIREPGFCAAEVNRLEQQFDVLVARALRQRNAQTHGRPIVAGVIDTIVLFTRDIANLAIQAIMRHGLEATNSARAALQDEADLAMARIQKMRRVGIRGLYDLPQ